MGPSGSGKSTLLNLLSLIDTPSSGTIKISNHSIDHSSQSFNDNLRANKIGIIYQDNNLLSDFTTIENIYLARLSISENKNKALVDAKKLIKKLGLSNRINHLASELSGGEMQRVAIARALINSPEIILADEISPDTCRLWDTLTDKKLDKDRFRKDLGDLIPAYTEVAKRLGILHEQSNVSAVNVTKLSSIKKRK